MYSMKKLALILLAALTPLFASAGVMVTCKQFPAEHFYGTDMAALTIVSTEPIVILVARYRQEDAAVYLPTGGTYERKGISPHTATNGKYIIKSSMGLDTVPYECHTIAP